MTERRVNFTLSDLTTSKCSTTKNVTQRKRSIRTQHLNILFRIKLWHRHVQLLNNESSLRQLEFFPKNNAKNNSPLREVILKSVGTWGLSVLGSSFSKLLKQRNQTAIFSQIFFARNTLFGCATYIIRWSDLLIVVTNFPLSHQAHHDEITFAATPTTLHHPFLTRVITIKIEPYQWCK